MPSSLILPRFTQVDAYGNPLVGGKLYTYVNGTTTPQTTYKDAAGTIANTNPIILDSLGSAVIFLGTGLVYTFVMKDANDALLWSQDTISGSQSSSGGVAVVTTLPTSDIGPVYLPGKGIFSWNGTTYVSDYSGGFGNGAYSERNKIINGCFRVWQRQTTFGPLTSASGNPYTADRWRITLGGTASATVTQQTAGTDYGQGRVGGYSARVTSNAGSTPAAADKNRFSQPIEGQNVLSLGLGSLWGGSFTLGFWVKASITGVYSVAFLNSGTPSFRSYVANYTVNAANVWEFKTVTVPIDSSGTANWDRTTGVGLNVVFDIGSGANSEGAVNTWLSTETTRTAGSVRVTAINNATWEVSNVQLEFGTASTPFELRPIAQELASCQRYYEKSYPQEFFPGGLGGGWHQSVIATAFLLSGGTIYFKVSKRATPTVAVYSPQTGVVGFLAEFNAGGTFVADRLAGASGIGTTSYVLSGTGTMTPANYISAHWTAIAEL
ncbi:hypothetical protein [Achromobacter xylosoxidans]|uniref:hypothetical protein n=1 Tax=Alcaligenes xylosoxydans xylosoxydans TaxID=85698 RepID=UPI001F148985|nr:hypothetical protein [Achromobacter xylosoxidans]